MASLQEVFGVSTSIPRFTYVDRSGLDQRFEYCLSAQRHIVLHGGSKQGKTVLRRKMLPEEKSIVIGCTATTTRLEVYERILSNLGIQIPTTTSSKETKGGEAGAKAGFTMPFLSSAEVTGKVSTGSESTQTTQAVAQTSANLDFVAAAVLKSGRRVIIEDFHYIPEDEKRLLAFDLKALWDLETFFIIVGIWAEQNLLTYYNSDLSGRLEEIDIIWTDAELNEVLDKGQTALNVLIPTDLRDIMISDANQNVGLLQRLAERLCYASGVYKTVDAALPHTIEGHQALAQARAHICSEERARYKQFGEAISNGFKSSSQGSELKVYANIARVAVTATDEELRSGIHSSVLFDRVSAHNAQIRRSDLTAALQRLNRLQEDRQISPLVLTFNQTQHLQLVDRELLFFRKYGNPVWPWDQLEEADIVTA
jgi:hypothetical protein